MVGTLLKSHKMRMSPEKQETLLKLSILSLAAILCKYISVIIHSLNVLIGVSNGSCFSTLQCITVLPPPHLVG